MLVTAENISRHRKILASTCGIVCQICTMRSRLIPFELMQLLQVSLGPRLEPSNTQIWENEVLHLIAMTESRTFSPLRMLEDLPLSVEELRLQFSVVTAGMKIKYSHEDSVSNEVSP